MTEEMRKLREEVALLQKREEDSGYCYNFRLIIE